ncbi:hypothetical protein LEN26_008069 [Aphanomyces euteiches]|nr:hypothetical protein AeMF1_001935 [Aphanomyces euteiches]KAH9130929.1 hypothetical protein LEN26_008069 [Aphanomyces euteiches]KAH9192273.1 hypothetical protein AeNC1_005752 [Aphanomyces euteiches]
MLTMLASDSTYLASPASTAYHSSSSPSSPGQASTTSSSDEHPTSLHHHHHLSFHHTTSSNNFSHMLASDLKTLQGGDMQLSQAVPAASSSVMQPPAFHVPPEMKCQYKTGTCTNMRTTKKNGKLLMLCELHRKKQNEIKKRSDRKQSAMRMNRRLEAKQKAMLADAKHKSPHHPHHHHSHHPSFKRTPKFEELLSCDPNQVTWDSHHSHPGSFDAPPPLALPRVNVWRTKDGIATGLGNGFKSFSFPNPFSPGSGQIFDWSALAPPSVVTTGGTPRGNDLAILEFFLDDN